MFRSNRRDTETFDPRGSGVVPNMQEDVEATLYKTAKTTTIKK